MNGENGVLIIFVLREEGNQVNEGDSDDILISQTDWICFSYIIYPLIWFVQIESISTNVIFLKYVRKSTEQIILTFLSLILVLLITAPTCCLLHEFFSPDSDKWEFGMELR